MTYRFTDLITNSNLYIYEGTSSLDRLMLSQTMKSFRKYLLASCPTVQATVASPTSLERGGGLYSVGFSLLDSTHILHTAPLK